MTVDPVVRAKLANFIHKSWCSRADCPTASHDDERAADALLGLPPSVRAQLVGIDGAAIQNAETGLDQAACCGFHETPERCRPGYTCCDDCPTSPVGVAGRNQPNPKEGDDA